MHAEAARGLGYVEIALDQRLVDIFPFQRLDQLAAVQRHGGIALALAERLLDIVGVGRLGEIVRRAQLDRLDGGGDAGEAGQHDDAGFGVEAVHRLHAAEAGGRAQLQVDHGIIVTALGQQGIDPSGVVATQAR